MVQLRPGCPLAARAEVPAAEPVSQALGARQPGALVALSEGWVEDCGVPLS